MMTFPPFFLSAPFLNSSSLCGRKPKKKNPEKTETHVSGVSLFKSALVIVQREIQVTVVVAETHNCTHTHRHTQMSSAKKGK